MGDPLLLAPSWDEMGEYLGDFLNLYRVLTDEVVPLYYDRDESGLPREWIERMRRSIGVLTPQFGTSRMVADYAEHYYLPSSRVGAE